MSSVASAEEDWSNTSSGYGRQAIFSIQFFKGLRAIFPHAVVVSVRRSKRSQFPSSSDAYPIYKLIIGILLKSVRISF